MTKIAINGFGRIGRLFFRKTFGDSTLDIVAINDLGDVENLAYLLKYDTVYGRYEKEVYADVSGEEKYLVVDGKKIRFFQEKDPTKLPWGTLGIDIVLESTGVFESFEKASIHCTAGAKRTILTAPAKDADGAIGRTVLMGINEDVLKDVRVSSNASCTTNAASPAIQILHESIGIEKAILNTVHGYTATQSIVDGPVKGNDFRRGRTAAQNIVPSTTGAAIAVTRAVPALQGKFDGVSMRVPVPSGSVADITCVMKRDTTPEEINNIFKSAAKEKRWEGILKVTEDQVVSSDILGEPYGAIIDCTFTKVVGGNLVKILSWYDNEAGYVAMLVKHVRAAAKFL
jgi:glyceraldehyde 3-phosphate dehydrogenase